VPQLINLTTHDGSFGAQPLPMKWGASDHKERGLVLATVRHQTQRNCIGAHSGGYSIYEPLAVAQVGRQTLSLFPNVSNFAFVSLLKHASLLAR